MRYELDSRTASNLEDLTGLNIETLQNIEFDEEKSYVEKVVKKPLTFRKRGLDLRRIGRGNPLLARQRFKTIEEVNKGLAKIK